MTFPTVSEELIKSIQQQVARRKGDVVPYYEDIFDEMKTENLALHDAIVSTVHLMCQRAELDPADIQTHFIINNVLNICACVYQSIKQQYIVNELKNE